MRHYLQLVLPVMAFTTFVGAQNDPTIRVHIMNGRTGKPVNHIRAYVSFDGKPYEIDQVLNKDGTIAFSRGSRDHMTVIPVGTVSCGEQRVGQPTPVYSLKEILEKGYVSRNDCGHYTAEPHRGDVVIYVRYATQLELFRN